MDEMNKNSISYKIQKNPFLLGLFVIVVAIALVAIISLTSAIQKKTKELQKSVTSTSASTTAPSTDEAEKEIRLDGLKKSVDTIDSVSADFDGKSAKIVVEFKDNQALLQAHYASNDYSIAVVPVFYFYINNGMQVGCPAQLKILPDGKTVEYILTEISDLANVVALTDELTVNYENIFEILKFNLYLSYASKDGVGRTLAGTYPKNVETFNKEDLSQTLPAITNAADGVKNAEIAVTDEFIWLDIYFENDEAYENLNHSFDNNFICFGFEKGGKKFDRKFITTEYDNLCMIRCKFDTYSLKELVDELDDPSVTIPSLFEYKINVWTSDYDTKTDLFTLN